MASPSLRRGLVPWLALPVVLLPLAWLLFTGLGHDPREIPSPLVGKPMPAFAGPTLTGETYATGNLAGKPAIVNFWASYCIPSCVEEHPFLIDVARRRPGGVQVLGVLYNDTPEGARGFLARYGDGGWPNMLDRDGRIVIDYGVTGPPETFFIDAAGIVRLHHFGPLNAASMAAGLRTLGIGP
jgi:cytochrome c biogenesis protein CcmG/thiol:disulfide interchange protein DsbE